jgi:RimJ/RimL family protein N-acetyltransferase
MTTIEELRPDHFELVAQWLSSSDINRWLTSEWRNRMVSATTIAIALRNRRNRLYLARSNSVPCGVVGLADIDACDQTAMVWYFLGERTLAGHGITSEAVIHLARLCFTEMGLASIYAWIMEDNTASKRVLEKAGFREAGRLRRAASSGGRQVDRVYFDLIASQVC